VAGLVKLEDAVYAHVGSRTPNDGICESMVFTPEKCVALGLHPDAVPAGRVWLGRLRDDEPESDVPTATIERKSGMRNSRIEQTTVSEDLAKAHQILIDHGLEGSELDRVVCKLNREASLRGAVLDGATVVDTFDVNHLKDQQERRRGLMAFRDRAVAKMRAGTSSSPGLSGEAADERFDREHPDWYPQYRSTF
jgi:hypothetical protein